MKLYLIIAFSWATVVGADCGIRNDERKWPWHAAVIFKGWDGKADHCAGTLVSSRTIVAHTDCLQQFKPDELSIGLGEDEFAKYSLESANLFQVHSIQKKGKVSLLKLKQTLVETVDIRPVCLPTEEVESYKNHHITGWQKHFGSNSPNLIDDPVNLASSSTAFLWNLFLKWAGYDSDDSFPANPNTNYKCVSADGLPVVSQDDDDKWVLQGIQLERTRSCYSRPAYFRRIKSIMDWVSEQTQGDNDGNTDGGATSICTYDAFSAACDACTNCCYGVDNGCPVASANFCSQDGARQCSKLPPSSSECGKRDSQARLVEGTNTDTCSHPWQALVEFNGYYFQSGTLIDKDWVLMDSHLFKKHSYAEGYVSLFKVYLGVANIADKSTGQVSSVTSIIRRSGGHQVLLRLSTSARIERCVRQICLPEGAPDTGSAMIAGWGEGQVLQQGSMRTWSATMCQNYYPNFYSSSFLCASGVGDGQFVPDWCNLDYGVPLTVEENGVWTLVGTAAVHHGFCGKDKPTFYASTFSAIDWIHSVIETTAPIETTAGPIETTAAPTPEPTQPTVGPIETTAAPTPEPTQPPTQPPVPVPEVETCGTRLGSRGSRIVNGVEAEKHDWPWQVYIISNDRFSCGGTLISKKWVLTAAHCLFGEGGVPVDFVKVYLGMHKKSTGYSDMKRVNKRSIHAHEYYNSRTSQNDIGLVELPEEVEFNEKVNTACLPEDDPQLNENMVVTGWGDLESNGKSPDALHEVELQSVDCYRHFRRGKITADMTCATGTRNNEVVDACQGDSGGPLVAKRNGKFNVLGVVSWGYGCAGPTPGVYANVYHFTPWIQSKIPEIRSDRSNLHVEDTNSVVVVAHFTIIDVEKDTQDNPEAAELFKMSLREATGCSHIELTVLAPTAPTRQERADKPELNLNVQVWFAGSRLTESSIEDHKAVFNPITLPAKMWKVADRKLETKPELQKQLQAAIVKLDPDSIKGSFRTIQRTVGKWGACFPKSGQNSCTSQREVTCNHVKSAEPVPEGACGLLSERTCDEEESCSARVVQVDSSWNLNHLLSIPICLASFTAVIMFASN